MSAPPALAKPAPPPPRTGAYALLVAAGILLSRIFGLARESVFAHYFGLSAAGGAFRAAFRIPNLLQNLFGEGVLSASFIPVYASLVAQGDERGAGRVASAILSLLALVTSAIVLTGVLAAPVLVVLVAPGFHGAERELTIRLVRILFPGAGLLVLSAWCLGILNSHHRFFLSYTAPVIWNVAIIASLLAWGARVDQVELAIVMAWGSVAGSALQSLVQLPTVLRLVPHLRATLGRTSAHVQTVVRNFIPVFIGRGVYQISAYVDSMLASLVGPTAVATLGFAQTLYVLPVSLFGMAVSAAELPAMSSATGSDADIAHYLRGRLESGLRRIAFFVVPSSMAFLALGDIVIGALLQSGNFRRDQTVAVWAVLAGSTVGLLAGTLGRLYSSTYYALRDTRTPLRFAIVRVALTTALGWLFAIPLPRLLGIDPKWGVVGLTMSAGIAGWIEFLLLRRSLNARIGRTGVPSGYQLRLWGAAALAAAVAWMIKLAMGLSHPRALGVVALGAYGVVYFATTWALGLSEARATLGAIARRMRRRGRPSA